MHRSAERMLELLSDTQVQMPGEVHGHASLQGGCCAAMTLASLQSAAGAHAVRQTAALTAGLHQCCIAGCSATTQGPDHQPACRGVLTGLICEGRWIDN